MLEIERKQASSPRDFEQLKLIAFLIAFFLVSGLSIALLWMGLEKEGKDIVSLSGKKYFLEQNTYLWK